MGRLKEGIILVRNVVSKISYNLYRETPTAARVSQNKDLETIKENNTLHTIRQSLHNQFFIQKALLEGLWHSWSQYS